jgi:hypothetical protein
VFQPAVVMAAPLVACWDRSAVVNSAERSVAHLADSRVEHWVVTTVDHSVDSSVSLKDAISAGVTAATWL